VPVKQIGLLPGEKLYEALMTSEEAMHARELADYYKVEMLKKPDQALVENPPAGYDSEREQLLSVDEIIALLEKYGLIEAFMEAAEQLPDGGTLDPHKGLGKGV
jgi:FlaA1/EpsC-like NDP-sugar epimerase